MHSFPLSWLWFICDEFDLCLCHKHAEMPPHWSALVTLTTACLSLTSPWRRSEGVMFVNCKPNRHTFHLKYSVFLFVCFPNRKYREHFKTAVKGSVWNFVFWSCGCLEGNLCNFKACKLSIKAYKMDTGLDVSAFTTTQKKLFNLFFLISTFSPVFGQRSRCDTSVIM